MYNAYDVKVAQQRYNELVRDAELVAARRQDARDFSPFSLNLRERLANWYDLHRPAFRLNVAWLRR